VKTIKLDPQSLGKKEDWEGNNIAVECPACEEVFIVSKQLHGDYKAMRFATDPAEIAAYHKGSITPLKDITRVIFLQRAVATK